MAANRMYKGWFLVCTDTGMWIATKEDEVIGPMSWDDIIAEISRREG